MCVRCLNSICSKYFTTTSNDVCLLHHTGNFTNASKYPCLGCQDGYLTEYLVRRLRWTYSRLSIDGLKSIIFHGPSPTLCIASGNVWFDYPAVNRVGCISQRTVRILSYHNPKYYDWMHMNFRSNKVCLRLSKTGFFTETNPTGAVSSPTDKQSA